MIRFAALLLLLVPLAACDLPRGIAWGKAATGPTPALLPAAALPAPGTPAPDPGTGLASQAAALQGRANGLRSQ